MSIRLHMAGMLAAALTVLTAGCATQGPSPAEVNADFAGKSYVLLGEVHDNPAGQQQRLAALTHAIEQGWRPAIAMEQFDRERQADIDRARRERADDADYLIAQAGGGGWQWPLYRPVVALALAYDLPLLAANLSRADAAKIVRGGLDGLFTPQERARLGLTGTLPPDLVAAQTAVLDEGHCGNFPKAMLPGMLDAQAARDAVMAATLRPYAARGAVLIAGNGHVRNDIGVPRWLGADAGKAVSVGYLEHGQGNPAGFDRVVTVAPVERGDPCRDAVVGKAIPVAASAPAAR
ncbi:ChaN family lipoprotein [Cupriavidus sp. WKF15]|uniref:ChaN family lipoprotein n=1 Tax=Cupriavidus sp. WKF15 TaxID=3032282 RepID=UPI0023E12B73|nr:ChaN family lipoprotein [Cupriavidus sp. WKF15]WER47794.1 ChaN family lipoprotein [Cupriavidus sp. WKF15]